MEIGLEEQKRFSWKTEEKNPQHLSESLSLERHVVCGDISLLTVSVTSSPWMTKILRLIIG